MILGSVNRPGPVPAFLRSPPVIPTPLDMKPFLQFPMESPHPASIGLFHNFNTMDPVQKAVMTHTFGPPMVKTKRPIISCNVCQIRFNSESQAEAHYKGNRHARRVKGIETSKTARLQDGDKLHPPPTASPSPPGPSPSSPEPDPNKQGTKHKTILEARSGLGPIKAYPRLGLKPSTEQGGELSSDPNTQERTFHCEICNVRVNSELQLKQHISSRRHRDGVAGKPNPLLSRHKKRTDFMVRTGSSTFSKELPKTLGAGLLPNPLAVAAAMAAAASSNQLTLRPPGPTSHPHPHHHILQGTPLSLLRPAPGPIRTTHGPILFTPY
ncbi:zinc finger protein 385A isoform X3 [Echeneis naucrates]|uniref:zinc finger protein 385A isoform X3 n=1 Tax=Echeneis naucrates TaxID=173247 RepID=UPI0011145D3D|nr:zinc finger protein 385A isoform X3 [Echeneis naucrates]